MKILLPPSETKREGGDGVPLDLDRLALPSLRPQRAAVLAALSRSRWSAVRRDG
nr:hypothetical protein [Microbacterium barkeri]